jgi:hypothetical protein
MALEQAIFTLVPICNAPLPLRKDLLREGENKERRTFARRSCIVFSKFNP